MLVPPEKLVVVPAAVTIPPPLKDEAKATGPVEFTVTVPTAVVEPTAPAIVTEPVEPMPLAKVRSFASMAGSLSMVVRVISLPLEFRVLSAARMTAPITIFPPLPRL
jgi:hypothetical protein